MGVEKGVGGWERKLRKGGKSQLRFKDGELGKKSVVLN